MIEQGHLADFTVKCIVLQHTDESKQLLKKALYKDEIAWIVTNEHRNKFIKNLALSLKGNTLILFQFVEKHGKILRDMFGEPEGKILSYVDGNVDGELREDVRQLAEQVDNMIIIASVGTFSTGVNIKNLHNVIFASPSKSRVRNLQSIGRVLRKSGTKQKAMLYDIADDLTWKSRKNHTLKHFEERMKIYGDQKFSYKIYSIQLKE